MVSIITATYNDAVYLRETIDSVLSQTYKDWEWIVVDNGSNDKTPIILNGISDPRIVIIRQEQNLGVSSGRNLALEKSKGEYICFLDGDDVLPERSIESRMAIFNQNDTIEFVDGKVLSFEEGLENITGVYTPNFLGNPLDELLKISEKVFCGNTWMIKRKPLKQYRFMEDLTHGEELMLYIKLSLSGQYAFTTDPVLYYRRHSTSAMSNIGGLEKGYVEMIEHLSKRTDLDAMQIRTFKNKVKSIMVRTYLKQGRLFSALNIWQKLTV